MGANGCGKSTFFLCCNGIYKPQQGEIRFKGKPIEYTNKGMMELRSKVGIVFQDPDNQLFSASVYQEISFGVLNLGIEEAVARIKVDQVMEQLGISSYRERPTHALSGGQKKQVSIADILVMEPDIIIMDEPAAALDPKHTQLVNDAIGQFTERGITVMMATHDVDYAYQWADEIILMQDGKVLAQGSPEQVLGDEKLLAMTNLEEPSVLRLYRCLCEQGIIESQATPPADLTELEESIKARKNQ